MSFAAHGARGDVQAAFQLYAEMKDQGMIPDNTMVGALATMCAKKLKSSKKEDRRTNLVLMERASNLIRDLEHFGIAPDTRMWNIFVVCAGRAGQLQRAFDTLQEMQERNVRADSVTYTALIDACAKSQSRDLGLRIYDLALDKVTSMLLSSDCCEYACFPAFCSVDFRLHCCLRGLHVWFGTSRFRSCF